MAKMNHARADRQQVASQAARDDRSERLISDAAGVRVGLRVRGYSQQRRRQHVGTSKETIEEFLARGGKIQRVVLSEDLRPLEHKEKWS